MNDWKEYRIRDISCFLKDGTHGTHKDVFDGVPLLSAKDIVNNKINIPEDTRLISEMDYDLIHKNYNIQEDDVLLTLVGSVGRAAVVPKKIPKFTIQRSVGVIRMNGLIDPKYFYYYITASAFQRQLINSINASAQGGVYLGTLSTLLVKSPPLPTQRKIACILSTIDGQIEKTEAIIAKYQAVKQGMLQDLFTRGIDVRTGQLRLRYEDAPDLYQESVLGTIPKEWEVTTLKNYMLEARGYIQTGPFGSQLHSHEYVLDGVPVIMPQDINEFTISTEIIAKIPQRKADSLGRHKVKKNDVVFARRGDVSRCTVIEGSQIGWLCGTGCILMRFEKSGVISPDWFKIFYKSEKSQNQVIANSVGSMMVNLNSKVLNDLKIYRLSYEEQLSIVSVLDSNDKSLVNLTGVLSKLQSLKLGMMQDLLSGKFEVTA